MRFLRQLDRVQKLRVFKIVASIAVAVLALSAIVTYTVAVHAPEVVATDEAGVVPDGMTEEQAEEILALEEATRRAMVDIAQAQKPIATVSIGVLVVAGVCVVVIWLGLGLTYLGLAIVAAGVCLPLSMFDATRDWARLLGGVVVLSAAFVALLEGLRLVYALLPGPIFAIGRNILSEAVRLKISLVFIVLLIAGLAATPGLLNESTPLRYRVQSFLQYGTAGAFWVIALLTLLLSAASVAFEQRDRVIWQTMTKPVTAWQYVLGKWVGVVGLSGVLLLVSGCAVFLFTEYLRGQTAKGEVAPYVSSMGPGAVSEDRRILHFQVLQAREMVEPMPPFEQDDPKFLEVVEAYIQDQKRTSEFFVDDATTRAEVIKDLFKQLTQSERSIAPAGNQVFLFRGLQAARAQSAPLVLRYRVQAGTNSPGDIYRMTFLIGGLPYIRQCGLDQVHLIDNIPPAAVDENGDLVVQVINGDAYQRVANALTVTFPPEGLSVSYPVGSFHMNFFRALAVLWLKLAFLSILGIFAATFLSFPVACLVAFGTFFAAESAGYLKEASEFYGSGTDPGLWKYIQMVVAPVARFVAWTFQAYVRLDPVGHVVEGKLIPWLGTGEKNPGLIKGMGILGAWCGVLYLTAVVVFRRRELATYSGQ